MPYLHHVLSKHRRARNHGRKLPSEIKSQSKSFHNVAFLLFCFSVRHLAPGDAKVANAVLYHDFYEEINHHQISTNSRQDLEHWNYSNFVKYAKLLLGIEHFLDLVIQAVECIRVIRESVIWLALFWERWVTFCDFLKEMKHSILSNMKATSGYQILLGIKCLCTAEILRYKK